MEHEATRTDEGEQRPLGFEVSTIMATTRRVVDIPQESAATASRLQVMEHDVNQLGGETGESIEHSQSGYPLSQYRSLTRMGEYNQRQPSCGRPYTGNSKTCTT